MAGGSPRSSIGSVVLVYNNKHETGLGHEYEENCNGKRNIRRPWFGRAIVNGRSLRGSRGCSSWDVSEFYVQEWCSRHPEGLIAVGERGIGIVRDTVDSCLQNVERVDTTVVMEG